MELVLLAGLFAGAMSFYWARDLYESTRDVLTSPDPTDAMQRVNERYAFAKIIVLAALADDEVSEQEWAVLRRLHEEHPDFDDDPEQVLSQLRFLQQRARSRDELERMVRLEAGALDPRLRSAAFQAAVVLAIEGPGFAVREGGAYRMAPKGDGEGLVEVFADALGVSPEEREAALERVRSRG